MSVKVKNLCFTYMKKMPGETSALKNVSLEIKDNSFVTIIGHTGSGKSTFIQHLNGLLIQDSGTIEIGNFVLEPTKRRKKVHELRKHVGVVFQFPEYQLYESTVEKDVASGPRNFGLKKEDALKKAHEYLLKVGIKEEYFTRSPFELSGGEKRRVAIAGILAIEPDILVLDEPTAGLDPVGQEEIINLLLKLKEEGKTIILVTHDMELVERYADQVIVFNEGEVSFDGTPSELFSEDRSELKIEVPLLYQFAKELNSRGYHFDMNEIRSIDDLVRMIKEQKK